jgi:hypothetical protein
MDRVLQPPPRDELGLSILPSDIRGNQSSDDALERIGNSADTPNYFTSLGMPAPPFASEEEVTKQARKWSKDVLADYGTLRLILERHEETIRKRWMKKTKNQRKTILLNSWPNMSLRHRPDYEAFRNDTDQSRSRGTKFRDAYILPSINLEDLTQNRTFLLLLNSRGRYSPQTFAHADLEMGRMGLVSRAILPKFLNMYTMYLDDGSVESYGKLVSWDESDEAMEAAMSRLAYQPGEGLLILEVQQRIMRFLIECCRAILHDFDSNSIASDQLPVKPEPPPIVDPADYSSLAAMAAEAPYRVPSDLDLRRLRDIFFAKRFEAEDHIWAMREDPGYFSDVIKEWSEHRQENVASSSGAPHPVLNTPVFWERVIQTVVTDAYGAQAIWDLLCNDLTELSALQEKHRKEIVPGAKLPEEYLRALLSFRYLLDQSSKGPIQTLRSGLPSSPPFRNMVYRQTPMLDSARVVLVPRPNVGVGDSMIWIFMTLWNDQTLFLCGLPDLMDELERLVQSDSEQKNRLTSWVANVLSDLGVLARAKHEIDIYFPWAAGFEYEYVPHKDAIELDFKRKVKVLAKIVENFKDNRLAKIGDPTDGRFYYPSEKRRTSQITNEMRKAEENLDAFWRAVDQHYQKKGGRPLVNSRQSVLENRQMERTPEWVEPIKPTKTRLSKSNVQEMNALFSHMSISQPVSSFELPTQKVKTKTRGETLSKDESRVPETLLEKVEYNLPIFKINNRTFKVFKALFHLPSQSDLPGETPWTDFLYAMAAMGFVPEKLYGTCILNYKS